MQAIVNRCEGGAVDVNDVDVRVKSEDDGEEEGREAECSHDSAIEKENGTFQRGSLFGGILCILGSLFIFGQFLQ